MRRELCQSPWVCHTRVWEDRCVQPYTYLLAPTTVRPEYRSAEILINRLWYKPKCFSFDDRTLHRMDEFRDQPDPTRNMESCTSFCNTRFCPSVHLCWVCEGTGRLEVCTTQEHATLEGRWNRKTNSHKGNWSIQFSTKKVVSSVQPLLATWCSFQGCLFQVGQSIARSLSQKL